MNMLASSSTTSSMSVLLPTTSKPLFSIQPNNVNMNKLKIKTNRFTVSAVVAEDASVSSQLSPSLQTPPQSQVLSLSVHLL